jgi:PmbA protein
MRNRDRLIKLALSAADLASDVIVRYVESRDNQIRFSNSQLDIAKSWSVTKMDVFVALGNRIGSTQIESPTEAEVESRVGGLMRLTEGMRESQLYAGISKVGGVAGEAPGLLDPKMVTFGEIAPGLLESVIDAAEQAGAKRVAGSLTFGRDSIEVRTNHGAEGSYEAGAYELTVRSFLDPESSGQGLACGRDVSAAEDRFREAGRKSGEIASMAEGGSQGRPGKYDVIMSPTVAANVLGQLAEGANPFIMMLGYSPLKDRIGEALGPAGLSIADEPGIPEGLGNRPFDDELVPTRRVQLFDGGRFVGVVHNTTSAKLTGGETTGSSHLASLGGSKIPMPWASNLVFQGGEAGIEEMISESSRPTIYVTSNWYTRYSNYLEGTFSTIPRDGIFLVEGGEISKAIRKIRISENMIDLVSRIEMMGKDVTQVHWWEVETPTFIPHVKVADVNITTATM